MFDKNAIEKIKEIVEKNAGDREVVFYGKHNPRMKALRDAGISINKVFTGSKNVLNQHESDIEAFSQKELNGKSNLYYILMPFVLDRKKQKQTLSKFGYQEIIDYCFLDLNSIEGDLSNTNITIEGYDNTVEVGEGCKNLEIFVRGNNNSIKIGSINIFKNKSNTVVGIYGSDSNICVGNACSFTDGKILCSSNVNLTIEEKSTFESNSAIHVGENASCRIGKDCLFSTDIFLQANNDYSVFDLTKDNPIKNATKDGKAFIPEIVIHDHVWVGRCVMICNSGACFTEVMDGCIIGDMSFVKGRFPKNVKLAGVPAQITEENVSWSRNSGRMGNAE